MKPFINTIVAFASLAALAFAGAEAGKAAPDFSLKTADGSEVKLSDHKGKNIVLEWVNFNCPFVKKHYNKGHMQKLQKQYAEKGVVWIQVASAHEGHKDYYDASALEAKAKEQKANASFTLVDADGTVGKSYGAQSTPHMFVVNKEGVIAYAGAIDSKKSTKTKDIKGADNYVAAALDSIIAGEKVATPETQAYGCSVKYEK